MCYNKSMHVFLALPYYLSWHYTDAFVDMLNIWKNFLSFLFEFFSIPLLLKTLFSPWRRMQESYTRIEDFFEHLIVNTLMRFVGAFFRLIIIIFGLASLFLCFVLGIVFFLLWTALPFILIYTLLQGMNLLTK